MHPIFVLKNGCDTTSKNRFTKVVALKQPPQLISISHGCFKAITSVNILIEAVQLGQPSRLIDINRGDYITMPALVKH
jgi:hypothetical protein